MSLFPVAALLHDRRGEPDEATIAGHVSLIVNTMGGSLAAGQIGVRSEVQIIDGGEVARDVTLPAASEVLRGARLTIRNSGAANLVVKSGSATVVTVAAAGVASVLCVSLAAGYAWVVV